MSARDDYPLLAWCAVVPPPGPPPPVDYLNSVNEFHLVLDEIDDLRRQLKDLSGG